MRKLAGLGIALAALSFVIGIISRLLVVPVPAAGTGLEASAFLRFTDTCLLTAIALLLLDKSNK
jgi:hypothetical protein